MSNLFAVNQSINNWTIIGKAKPRRTPQGQIKHYWLCKCICGKCKEVYAGSLKSNKSKGCGCNRLNKKEKGEASLHNIFLCYKSRAKRKNLEFTLNKDEFTTLIKQPCFYCDKVNSNYMIAGRRNGGFYYNGIDRVDNTKGYTKENCNPCCKYCNKAKLDQTHDEFLNMISIIYNKHIKNKKDVE